MIELHLINDLRHGGAQTQLCAAVRDAKERGDIVHVASLSASLYRKPEGIADALKELGASVHPIGQRFAVDPFAALRLKRLLYAIDPERVRTWDSAAGQLLRAAGRPGEAEWEHVVRELDSLAQVTREDLLLARHADLVVPTSDAIAQRIQPQCETECRVELNQSFLSGWVGEKESARRELNLPAKAKLAVMIGRLDDARYLKEAIWNADLVRILYENFRLVIVGEGPCRQAGERFACGATEPNVIHFVGNQTDVAPWLATADVVWCPLQSVGLSTPLVEAMRLAKPVIAATAPGREKILTDGVNGYLADYSDRAAWTKATDKLLSNSTHAEEVGQAGKSTLMTYSETAANYQSCSL